MDLTAELLAKVDAHCARTGMSKARLATIVANDGKFFDRIARGGSLTVKTYERIIAWLDESDRKAGSQPQAIEGQAGEAGDRERDDRAERQPAGDGERHQDKPKAA